MATRLWRTVHVISLLPLHTPREGAGGQGPAEYSLASSVDRKRREKRLLSVALVFVELKGNGKQICLCCSVFLSVVI